MMDPKETLLAELVELQDLLDVLNEDELTVEQDARLQEIVAHNEPARQYYLQMMFFFGQLRWKVSHQNKEENPPQTQKPASVLGFLGETYRWGADSFLRDAPFALFLIFVLVGFSLGGAYWLVNTLDRRFGGSLAAADGVAQITSARDCRWATTVAPPSGAMRLQVGQQLKLEEGIVQITYNNGAEVLLEGPASFTVDSSNSGFLGEGRLTAHADSEASRRFTIGTSSAFRRSGHRIRRGYRRNGPLLGRRIHGQSQRGGQAWRGTMVGSGIASKGRRGGL